MNRRSLILDTCVRAEFHTLCLVSLYLLFAGHNQPGGGFAGGLVLGAGLALRYASGGPDEVRATMRVAPTVLLGVGLLLAVLTAVVPLAFGGSLLESTAVKTDLPLLGTAKTSSALVFDAGVYLVVVGTVALLLDSLGRTADDEPTPDPEPRP